MTAAPPAPPRRPPEPALIARFAAIVGERHALTRADDIAPYLAEERRLYHGCSALVLRPGTTAEVAAICALASETRTALVPQGGNTGLVGGQTPHHGEVVLSLKRLERLREIDTQTDIMICEAGMALATAQQHAAAAQRLFPLSLGSEGSCTIGGNLSTNAGGTAALAYGLARDMATGLEVVLADGRVLNTLTKLKKDNTGYNLHNLFIGAEGTLGIITAASLKLFPKPRTVATAFVGLASPQAALQLLTLAQREAATTLTSFELMAEIAIATCVTHGAGIRDPLTSRHPWYVLIEISSPRTDAGDTLEAVLTRALEDGVIADAAIAASLDQRHAFWMLREAISPLQRFEGGSIKHDVSVPVATVPQFLAEAGAAVTKLVPGARPFPFGHLGDGNIHYNVSEPENGAPGFMARWDEVSAAVFAVVRKLGGSISAEHGIGVMKRDDLPEVKDPVAYALMRQMKALLDPLNILNPGKVV